MNNVCKACVNEQECINAHVTDDEYIMSNCSARRIKKHPNRQKETPHE